MKKARLFHAALCVLLCACSPAAPEKRSYPESYSSDSGFHVTMPDSLMPDNLDVLGRVWGYVKYHHPAFGTQAIDADYELFNLLPQVTAVSRESRNQILLEWIDRLGDYETDSARYNQILIQLWLRTPIYGSYDIF